MQRSDDAAVSKPFEARYPATLDDLAAHHIVTRPLGPSHLIEVFSALHGDTRFAPYRKFAVERTS
ncbi:hypothetical protein [Paraburkholderia caribensis]|uniref:hypothetical protein n=1 Tax=Paraburkholderia caribensis TaxID=75105 RepID=UPI001D074773|nr:hypothetical protein [Paraburkholderia caribensis]